MTGRGTIARSGDTPSKSSGVARSWADPEVRARRLAAMRAGLNRPEVKQKLLLTRSRQSRSKIPLWVPDSLIEEYREIAGADGEEAAARHCRRLKREMAEPNRSFAYSGASA